MLLKISASDYHTIMNVRSHYNRIRLSVDESNFVKPDVVSIHTARTRKDEVFFTAKQCVELLDTFHVIDVVSDSDSFETHLPFSEGTNPFNIFEEIDYA